MLLTIQGRSFVTRFNWYWITVDVQDGDVRSESLEGAFGDRGHPVASQAQYP